MSYHVRDVLESVQAAAPPPRTSTDDIIATARRMRARRTIAAAAGGCAAVVAVVVTAVAGFTAPPPSTPTAASPSGALPSAPPPSFAPVPSVDDVLPDVDPPKALLALPTGFRTVLGEYRTGKYRIGPVGQVTARSQALPVYRDGATWEDEDGTRYPLEVGSVTFYRAGVYDPAQLGAEEPGVVWGEAFGVKVAGRPGIGREMRYGWPDYTAGVENVRTALAWQYAPDAWATYMPRTMEGSQTRADALAIAGKVSAAPARDVRAPFRLGFVPAGWQVVSVTETPAALNTTVSEVLLHRGALPADVRAGKVDVDLPVLRIGVFHGEPKDREIRGKDGVHCYTPNPSCTVVRGEYLIDVEGRFAEGLTAADVRRVVDGLQVTDLEDRDAWVPVGR